MHRSSILLLLILLAAGLCKAVPQLQGNSDILQDRVKRTAKVIHPPVSHASGAFCGDPGIPANGSSLYKSRYEGAIVIHSCNLGHVMTGSARRLCEKNGKWIPKMPRCVAVYCKDPGVPPQGSRWMTKNNFFGSVVRYSCNKGFTLSGHAMRLCQRNGLWSGKLPTCIGKGCPLLPLIKNGHVNIQDSKSGSTAKYSCKTGFVLVGKKTRTCGHDGIWQGTAPSCRKVNCRSLKSPKNGLVSFKSTHPGSTATYSCSKGFILVGTTTRRCKNNGEWSHSAPICREEVVNCLSLPNIKNGQLTITGNTLGSIAQYICNKGFKLVGSKQRDCQRNGVWSSTQPFCKKNIIDCGSLASPKNGYVSFHSTHHDSTATYSCSQGFTLVGKATRTCQSNGHWSGSAPHCRAEVVNCPYLPHIKHGQVTIKGNSPGSPGSIAHYTCDLGFTLVGDSYRTCQTNGVWSLTEPFCTKTIVNCKSLANPDDGQVSLSGISVGSTATYTCSSGFLLVGVEVRVCQSSGLWSATAPRCQIIDCGSLTDPLNGFVAIFSTMFGSTAVYSCEAGFVLVGTGQRTCQADATWSGSEPWCQKSTVGGCATLPDPDNGKVFLTGNTVGSAATYVCDASYRLEGSRIRICLATGEWSEEEPICLRTGCSDLSDPTNGLVTLTGTFTGSVATYSCNSGYALLGTLIRVCLFNGQWSSIAPVCEREGCAQLTPPINSGISFSDSNRVNSVATYLCDPGFVLVGLGNRRCQTNKLWTGSEPFCRSQQQNSCPSLEPPKDGKVSFSGTDVGSTAFYSCLFGYTLVGAVQRVCLESGQWSGYEPLCQGVQCGTLPPPDNGAIEFSEGTTFGSFITYSCFPPYQLVGTATRVCQASGVWSDVTPFCESLQCPELVTPLNGVIIQSGNFPVSTATYSCASGYSLVGAVTRNCLNNGFWSGEDPECKRTDCGTLPDPKNGEVELTGTLAGSRAIYTCNEGFVLEGARFRECLESGEWSEEEPDCEVASCGQLEAPDNGRVDLSGTELGDSASYSCNQGYQLLGEPKRQCREDGTWSGEQPECERLECGSLPDPVNGVVTMTGTTSGSTATYSCDLAFSLVGQSTRVCEALGNWSGAEPECVANVCPTLSNPANGHVEQRGNNFGATATYSCNPGYKRDGHVTRTCLASGEWSSIAPQCNPILCKSLIPPRRGKILLSDGMKLGSIATYKCNEGYNLGGGAYSRTCNANGHWSGIEPYCEIVDCGAIPHPANGAVSVSGLFYDSLAAYSCSERYVLEGVAVRRCLADGSWSDVAPICKFKVLFDCGELSQPLNGRVVFQGTTTGSTATYNCNPGYFLQGGNDRQKCVDEIGWDGIPPHCQPVDCGILVPPLFGHVVTTEGSTFGSIATYICDEGHSMDGSATRTCLSGAEWTGEAPLCIPIDCGPVPRPQNGLIFFSGTTFGLMVTYSCNVGYELIGENERTCQASGEWSGSEPICKRSDDSTCGDPGTPSNGVRVGEDFSTGATVGFECYDGYHLEGKDYITCLPSGQWTGSIPSCDAVDDTQCSVEGSTVLDECGRRCTCTHGQYADCCRVRADYASMSTEEKLRYVHAVRQVASDPAYKSRYDTLVATYKASYDTPAQESDPQSSQFLVWNRYFLLQYEDLLREVDCRITIPYWDWTPLPMNPYMSPVFDPETGFGDASSDDYCVINGPFNYTDFAVTPSADGGCLERQYLLQMYPTRAIVEQDLLTYPAEEFDEFHRFLQLFVFTNIRCFVGGHMCSADCANDPLLLLHMAQIDAIFTRWQVVDVSRLNARYVSDNRPLVLTNTAAIVSDYSNNGDLPNDIQICYDEPQFESHIPASMAFLSDTLLEITNNRELRMGCAAEKGHVEMGEAEEEFMKRMCEGAAGHHN